MKRTSIRLISILIPAFSVMSTDAFGETRLSDERVPAFEKLDYESSYHFARLPSIPENTVESQLLNGVPANPGYFPAIIAMTTGGTCTASIVGPASVLLAAHCVPHFSRISFNLDGATTTGICERSPGYMAFYQDQDWALCLLEHEVSGIAYESVDLEALPATGDGLVLTGYGCTYEDGPLDGVLRIGVSKVVEKPSGWPDETSTIYTRSDLDAGEAVLCPGDSGGPLFRFSGGFTDSRQIVGVNSRTTYAEGVSLFSAMASPAGVKFIEDWAARHQQQICGFNRVHGCR